ncbi:ABC transporter permease [Candidatus Woesearchaeota archaeon]|nr:ABC transporter permease [Candidatus Woesearchaeota archaeon]MBW3017973.1 ABC transporter permease [Candidatus Woesearchaeota archaeon]
MFAEYFKIAIKNMRSRKLRSYLTMIGIIIGITALIALITLGQGMQKSITDQFDKFGTRRIFIGPKIVTGFSGPSGITELTQKDVETLERLSYLEYVVPMLGNSMQVEYNNKKEILDVSGMGTKDIGRSFTDLEVELLEGRFLEENDNYAVVIGYRIATDLFDKTMHAKNSIRIGDIKFRVEGIFEEQGDRGYDYAVYIPIETMRKIMNKPGAVSGITANVKVGTEIELATEKIERELKRSRDDENFQVTTPQKIKEQTGIILGIVNLVVAAIAGISLIVGGLGIMNSMYTSVLERTREIGVMKAIGAKNSNVFGFFLVESGIMGFTGGIIGIIIGLLISFGLIAAINTTGFITISLVFDYRLVLFGLGFSFGLGMLSGTLPAVRAAKLKPVDALRYE